MKSIINISLFTLAAITLASCKADKFTVYESESRVYFSWAENTSSKPASGRHHSIFFGVSEVQPSDMTISIPITVLGRQVNYQRNVAYTIDMEYSDLYENVPYTNIEVGEDIELGEAIIPANSSIGYINIKLINNDKLEEAKDLGLSFAIRLLPNEHFLTDHNSILRSSAGVTLKDSISIKMFDVETGEAVKDPETEKDKVLYKIAKYNTLISTVNYNNLPKVSVMWLPTGKESSYSVMMSLFGPYSRGRVDFICQTLGLPSDFFDPDLEALGMTALEYWQMVATTSANLHQSWKTAVVNALNDYWRASDPDNRDNRKYPLDEHGKEIEPVAKLRPEN